MPARNHSQWLAKPPVEYVDSRIYSDPDIFEDELELIFKKTWVPICHESELSEPYDFRTTIGIIVFLLFLTFEILGFML